MNKEFDFKEIGKRTPFRTPEGFFERMQAEYPELLERFEQGYFDESDVKTLESALESMRR